MVERRDNNKSSVGGDIFKVGLGLLIGAAVAFVGSKLIEKSEKSSEGSS